MTDYLVLLWVARASKRVSWIGNLDFFSPLKQITAVKHAAHRYRRCWCYNNLVCHSVSFLWQFVYFIRYQLLAGVIEQRILEPLLHNQKLILSAMSFIVRTGNTFLGSLLWVTFTTSPEVEILHPAAAVFAYLWTLWTAGLTTPDG